MRRLVFREPAREDIRDLIRYITEQSGSTQVAVNFTDRLRARCHRLAGLPGTLGQERPELAPGLRSVAEGDYLILFRYAADRLEVVRILHGHRDLGALFG